MHRALDEALPLGPHRGTLVAIHVGAVGGHLGRGSGRTCVEWLERNCRISAEDAFRDRAANTGAVTRAAAKKMAVRQVALTILT